MSAETTPEISVVVSGRDAAATIERAVRSMLDQAGAPSHEVIVVDNASNDDTGRLAEGAGARVIRLDDRAAGPGLARNAGVAAARGSLIAFTDADCYPPDGWLAALARGFRCGDIVSGPILPDPEAVGRSHWDRTISVPDHDPLYPTANLAVRRDAFLEVGGFSDWHTAESEAPSHPYGEDSALAWRLIRGGSRPQFVPEAVVHHAVFDEDARRWIARHAEMQHLPELVRMIPELRREMLLFRLFASKRTLGTSVALAGLLAAIATRRDAPLVGVLPAIWLNTRRTAAVGPAKASVWAVADLVSVWSLIRGSIRARTIVL